MPSILSRAKDVLVDVPKHGKLAYCLLRDDRVPAAPKAVLLAALAVIVRPIDLPAWIPGLGGLGMPAPRPLAVPTFLQTWPEGNRPEQPASLRAEDRLVD